MNNENEHILPIKNFHENYIKNFTIIGWITLLLAVSSYMGYRFLSPMLTQTLGLPATTFLLIGLLSAVLSTATFTFASVLKPVLPLHKVSFWLLRGLWDVFLGALAIPITAIIAISNFVPSPLFPLTGIVATSIGLLMVILLRYYSHGLPKEAIQFSFSRWPRSIGITFLSIIAISALIVIYSLLLTHFSTTTSHIPQSSTQLVSDENIWIIHMILVVLVPICEELFFRGYILTVLAGKWPLLGHIITSIVFAAIHLDLLHFVSLFILSLVSGIAYLKTKNLLVPITLHILNNLAAFVLLPYLAHLH